MTALVCGKRSKVANVAPPLKSTSTKFSSSDDWVAASASTIVRSISDLPEPVAPMMSPCGPMPPCAASLKSSMTLLPSGSNPTGMFNRCAFGWFVSQTRRGSNEPA